MEEENSRSFEAFQEKLNQNSKQSIEGKEENKGEKAERSDEQRRLSRDSNCDFAGGEILKGESKAPESETPAPVKLSGGDYQADFDESSHHLSDVPVEYSLQPLQSAEDLKDQVKAVHKESFTGNTGRSAEVQVQHQIQAPDGPSKLEPLRKSVTKSISSVEISDLREQKVQPAENGNNACFTGKVKKNFPDPKHLSIVPMRTPSDGYNWRKYGQKQVKSPEGSRSYYRCTFSDCYAKKIECSDTSNRLVETVYRSQHNHDPPQKVNYSRENKPALPIVPVNGSSDTSHLLSHDNDPLPSSPSKEPLLGLDEIPETKQELSDSDDTAETNVKEQYTDGPECKKRQKKNSTGEVEFTPKPGKKPKFVVHAAGEVGISGDGYRWRKYGQKMVKGNPHPRNYYRCTSAGCPVRKHIETATDNSSAVVITYKGVHDHDTPVPRKRNGPKSGITVATSPVSMTHLQNKTKCLGQTQWSEGKEGKLSGEAMVEGEKASESTKTLLSVGFEIKPC